MVFYTKTDQVGQVLFLFIPVFLVEPFYVSEDYFKEIEKGRYWNAYVGI